MALLWVRPPNQEARFAPDERRVRDFVGGRGGVSESATSLAAKLGINRRHCQRALEVLAREGIVRRRDFADIESLYSRYPSL